MGWWLHKSLRYWVLSLSNCCFSELKNLVTEFVEGTNVVAIKTLSARDLLVPMSRRRDRETDINGLFLMINVCQFELPKFFVNFSVSSVFSVWFRTLQSADVFPLVVNSCKLNTQCAHELHTSLLLHLTQLTFRFWRQIVWSSWLVWSRSPFRPCFFVAFLANVMIVAGEQRITQ